MSEPTLLARALGWCAYEFARLQPFIPTYLHLIVSALFPIYTGAFSSLSRPSSAAKKVKEKDKDGKEIVTDEEEEQKMEGLSPTDALVFPLLAGATLTGLYFLIKWLDDPALLNKILNWYFASFSVFSVSKLVSDGLDVFHSILFPYSYVDQGRLYSVDWKSRRATSLRKDGSTRASPLPGIFSRIPLPGLINELLWTLHVLPNRKLQFKAVIRKVLYANLPLGIHGIEGLIVGLSTVLWYNFISKPWWLTNLMGFGFAYGTLQLMSPTTFWTGTMILSGLFFYDIYFVFFTPMMVTVAKSLDIPIKLLFPRPPSRDDPSALQAMSMLGLGDVVLPGIMIGLALRFDLYMYYFKKQTKGAAAAPTNDIAEVTETDETSNKSVATREEVQTEEIIIKAHYQTVAGGWGDRLWTSSLLTGFSRAHGYVARNAFPKPYFHAGLIGYTIGMLVTLGVMQIFEHAQPALLYLVPGVLTALWGTAWASGEIKQMWNFSEASEEETEEEKKKIEKAENDEKDEKDGKVVSTKDTHKKKAKSTSFFSMARSEDRAERLEKAVAGKKRQNESALDCEVEDMSTKDGGKDDRTLISFSISLPPPISRSTEDESQDSNESKAAKQTGSHYNLRSNDTKSPERAEKRQRLS